MKIILSRKGFDSTAGGCPSPIVDGRPVPLPIPTTMPSPVAFGDLPALLAVAVADLTRGRITPDQRCHLDPDIDRRLYPRPAGWRGALGQAGAAQGHLANQGVGPGDLFLFWGLYRPVAPRGRWRFTGAKEHRLFGWLQVDEVVHVGRDPEPALRRHPWLAGHPHLQPGWGPNNAVYVAARKLSLGGASPGIPGWGVMSRGLRLTVEKGSPKGPPSHWRCPDWLHPRSGGSGMTYHPPARWLDDGTVMAAARGQEFVADVDDDPRAVDWIRRVLQEKG
ncbi:MAG: hypothetical protein ACODAC_12095 [Pseudomonadota bacterium]